MYRVVLIDDERLIVEGLSRVVKWADYGCEVAATSQPKSAHFTTRHRPSTISLSSSIRTTRYMISPPFPLML